jgi:hypothetical protein
MPHALHALRASTATGPPLLERKREILAGQAKERQIRKPADSVVGNLPPQTDKTRDAVAAEIGVSGRVDRPTCFTHETSDSGTTSPAPARITGSSC